MTEEIKMEDQHGRFGGGLRFKGASDPSCVVGDQSPPLSLSDLTEGPYYQIAACLDATSLCQADATCRSLRDLHRAYSGPWHALGSRAFHGLEIDGDGTFD